MTGLSKVRNSKTRHFELRQLFYRNLFVYVQWRQSKLRIEMGADKYQRLTLRRNILRTYECRILRLNRSWRGHGYFRSKLVLLSKAFGYMQLL